MNRTASVCAMVMSSALLAACGGSGGSKATSSANTTSTASTGTTATSASTTNPTAGAAQSAAGSTETSPGVVRASSGGTTATMHAPTHHPHVNKRWPIAFVVTHDGKPVKAEVRYEYVFAGQVVARRSHYTFTGSFHDIFTWPSSAVGYPLTFRAVITADGATLNLDYPVQVLS